MGQRCLCTQGSQMLALWTRLPLFESTSLHTLPFPSKHASICPIDPLLFLLSPLPSLTKVLTKPPNSTLIQPTAHHHQIPRLHRRQRPTPHRPSLRLRLHPHRQHRHPLRAATPARPLHPRLVALRRHRLLHPAQPDAPNPSPRRVVPRHLLRRRRHLPGRRARAELARHQRLGPDEARHRQRDADLNWELGRRAGYAAISERGWAAVRVGAFVCVGVFAGECAFGRGDVGGVGEGKSEKGFG